MFWRRIRGFCSVMLSRINWWGLLVQSKQDYGCSLAAGLSCPCLNFLLLLFQHLAHLFCFAAMRVLAVDLYLERYLGFQTFLWSRELKWDLCLTSQAGGFSSRTSTEKSQIRQVVHTAKSLWSHISTIALEGLELSPFGSVHLARPFSSIVSSALGVPVKQTWNGQIKQTDQSLLMLRIRKQKKKPNNRFFPQCDQMPSQNPSFETYQPQWKNLLFWVISLVLQVFPAL